MKFRNYCIVVMGNTAGVLDEIEKVSDSKPNILDAKGILISTFTSNMEPNELNDWFRLNKRSFLVFDLNPNNSGFFIVKPDIQEGLFGFLKSSNIDFLNEKTMKLLREIEMTSDTKSNRTNWKEPANKNRGTVAKITDKDIARMTKEEKDNLFNKIIDNGVENMSEEDKIILQILSK